MQTVAISIGTESYPFYWSEDAAEHLKAICEPLEAENFIVITDQEVLRRHGRRLLRPLFLLAPVHIIMVPRGEEAKSFGWLQSICQRALRMGASRRSVVVTLGGGSIGNLGGVAAGLLFRGLRLVHLPTTPMAAFDSVISLKQAVNALDTKNIVGLYLTPAAVVVDLISQLSLDERTLRAGVCETIKNTVAIHPDAFDAARQCISPTARRTLRGLEEILRLSIDAKLSVMAEDPREQGQALVLEYGHTLGHAIELADLRQGSAPPLSHGECVAIGMAAAASISEALGLARGDVSEMQNDLFRVAEVETGAARHLSEAAVLSIALRDNKRGRIVSGAGQLPMILLRKPGAPVMTRGLPLVNVNLNQLANAVRRLELFRQEASGEIEYSYAEIEC